MFQAYLQVAAVLLYAGISVYYCAHFWRAAKSDWQTRLVERDVIKRLHWAAVVMFPLSWAALMMPLMMRMDSDIWRSIGLMAALMLGVYAMSVIAFRFLRRRGEVGSADSALLPLPLLALGVPLAGLILIPTGVVGAASLFGGRRFKARGVPAVALGGVVAIGSQSLYVAALGMSIIGIG